MKHVSNTARRNTLAVALMSALMAAAPAMAQDKATNLDKITVTGSLIPQTQVETQTPVMSITAEDIQTRGFSSVAEVIINHNYFICEIIYIICFKNNTAIVFFNNSF